MDAYPHRVVLRSPRFKEGVGYCDDVSITHNNWVEHVRFNSVVAKSFVFSHAAALLVMQGMLLKDLFVADASFQHRDIEQVVVAGPFLFLKGQLSQPVDPPLRLSNLALAQVSEKPAGMSSDELLSILLRAVG